MIIERPTQASGSKDAKLSNTGSVTAVFDFASKEAGDAQSDRSKSLLAEIITGIFSNTTKKADNQNNAPAVSYDERLRAYMNTLGSDAQTAEQAMIADMAANANHDPMARVA